MENEKFPLIEPHGKIYYHGSGININTIFLYYGQIHGFWVEKENVEKCLSRGGVELVQFIKDGRICYEPKKKI